MDPDACLQELRAFVIATQTEDADFDADRAADLFEALDDWLSRGGFLPKEWAHGRGYQDGRFGSGLYYSKVEEV